MTKQKTKVKIYSSSSIKLGKGIYGKAIIRSDTLQTVPGQNKIKVVAEALYKSYKTSYRPVGVAEQRIAKSPDYHKSGLLCFILRGFNFGTFSYTA